MKFIKFLAAFIILLGVSSCKTQNPEYNYLKDIESIAVETSVKNSRSTIQPGDQLEIFVMAKDMDVTVPFNQSYSSSTTVSSAQRQGRATNGELSSSGASGPVYLVDTDGFIHMNVIGKVSTAGLNLEELRDELQQVLSRYIKNPVVSVKNVNFKITVMGEVNKPDTYVIPDGKITILSALGLAGDLTMYGVRNNVLVVRNVDGEILKQRIDLTSANFINSPVYYLKQNDVVYVEANETKQKTSRLDPNTGTYIAIGGVVISLASVLILLFRK